MSLDAFAYVTTYAGHRLWRCKQPDDTALKTLKEVMAGDPPTIFKLNSNKAMASQHEAAAGFNVVHNPPNQWHPEVKWGYAFVEKAKKALAIGDAVIHCTHGRDRTGFAVAFWRRVVEGWTAEAALEELREFGVQGLFWWTDAAMVEIIRELKP